MLSVDEALGEIESRIEPLAVVELGLGDALRRVLATDLTSDVDSPPFDKALMDGFAVRADDVADGTGCLSLIAEVTAGEVSDLQVGPGEAIQIMTGAPIPDGADAVVRIEDCQSGTRDDGSPVVNIRSTPVSTGQDLVRQGTSMRRGDSVLAAGCRLRAQELALLAELGRDRVPVRPRPRVGVLATGDELVEIGEVPGPGQIRNTNETMLAAQVEAAGGEAVLLGIARDRPEHLAERIEAGLDTDILLLSGGVSAGRLDLVPAQLAAAGVEPVFHKVQVKPGKPLWFGIHQHPHSGRCCAVFGLPGNPVSSMVCFELFVRTALRRLTGHRETRPASLSARLTTLHATRGDRPTYFPARLDRRAAETVVTPVDWHGSSDLRATVDANAMILFPPGERTYQPDDLVDVFAWD